MFLVLLVVFPKLYVTIHNYNLRILKFFCLQHIASEESATDLTDGLLSGEHVHEEQPLEQEGDGPFDNGDLCVSEGVGEMSPVEPLSPTINPLSPGLHDPSESEIHQDISQLTYTG